MRAAVVFPAEFNRVVARTRSKSLLLFQKCGLILQEIWRSAGAGPSWVLVDRHGARSHYRRLLRDVFPDCPCDILREGDGGSVYRIADPGAPGRVMHVAFKEKGDTLALPTALASMTAKYVRELYMRSFNLYWQQRLAGLKPTAGYAADARRFLKDVAPALRTEGVEVSRLVRTC
jgi:ribonuclease HII